MAQERLQTGQVQAHQGPCRRLQDPRKVHAGTTQTPQSPCGTTSHPGSLDLAREHVVHREGLHQRSPHTRKEPSLL